MTGASPPRRALRGPACAPRNTYIGQGEFAVDQGADAVISTLLGSCVSACLWDPQRGIGGMNHVVFVDENDNGSATFGHGVNCMELLINALIHLGAEHRSLKAKVFGGAQLIHRLSGEGARNGEFVVDFLCREGIEHVGGDIGGHRARRLEFWPETGRVRMKYVAGDSPVASGEPTENDSGIELF